MLPMSIGRLSLSSLLSMSPPPNRREADGLVSPKHNRRGLTRSASQSKLHQRGRIPFGYKAGIAVVTVCLLVLAASRIDLSTTTPEPSSEPAPLAVRAPGQAVSRPRRSRAKPLKFNKPTRRFRDNLLDNHLYLSVGHVFGFEQQQWQIIKAIHLARKVFRTPILDNLHPEDDPLAEADPHPRRVSDFFDLAALQDDLDWPVLEWADVKTMVNPIREDLAGWAAFGPWKAEESLRDDFNIRSHFWEMPPDLATYDNFKTLELLASRSWPNWTEGDGRNSFDDSWWEEHDIPDEPDEQVFHLDKIFFTREERVENGKVDGWETPYHIDERSPSWLDVGAKLQFKNTLNAMADKLARDLLRVSGTGPFPYLAVHVTKREFAEHEWEHAYSLAIRAMQEKLVFERGVQFGSLPVIFTTDAVHDKPFMRKLIKFGWKHLDHKALGTAKKYGGWYPSLMDHVVMSRAIGFAGSWNNPTASLAARRVETWQNGFVRLV